MKVEDGPRERRRAGEARIGLVMVALVWTGMLLAIPFMEAWVKFRAPSLSLEEGLDVGRQVFGALNLVEVVVATALLALVALARPPRRIVVAIVVAAVIVALQSVWLLPVLDDRVEVILAGGDPPDAPYHVLYIGLEVVKFAAVGFAGIASLRRMAVSAARRAP